MKNIKFIYFDIGGIILEKNKLPSFYISKELGIEESKYKNVEIDIFNKRKFPNNSNIDDEIEYYRNNLKLICKTLKLEYSDKLLQYEIKKDYYLKEYSLELLDFLKNKYKLGVLSNGKPSRRIYEFKNFGLDKYFEVIILSKETPYNKPDRRIFQMAVNKVGLPLDNILFIDNDIENIKGAEKFGIENLIYFNENGNIKSSYIEVRDLKEIKNILK